MNNDRLIKKRSSRRLFITGAFKGLAMTCLVGRLYYLQVAQSNQYHLLSDKNRIKVSFNNALRGSIFDSTGVQLADNKKQYNLAFIPMNGIDIKLVVRKLLLVLQLPSSDYPRLYDLLQSATEVVIIQEDIAWTILQEVEFHSHELQGVVVVVDYKRYYYKSLIFSHVIGYARRVMYHNDIYLYTGKRGIEYIYDDKLKGKPGVIQQEVNSKRQIIRSLSRIVSSDGEDIHLSINYHLQSFIFKILNQTGSALVIDVETGKIVAMNNFPHYDNNLFIKPILKSTWNALTKNDDAPLLNRAVAMQVPPCSTFKLMSALAALEAGVIDADTHFTCKGHMTIGGRVFHCWKREGHGSISLSKAISSSCNVYFYNIARAINIDQLLSTAELFGFGQAPNLGFKEEVAGVIPNRKWREQYRQDAHWYVGDTVNSIIGHGYVLVTPLQLAIMTTRLATGLQIVPSLLLDQEPGDFPSLNIRSDHLQLVREGMYNAVRLSSGTAHRVYSRFQDIAGKTGTGAGQNINLQEANNNYALFVGYSSYQAPKYAVAVVLERSHIGSAAASSIAKQIFNYIHQKGI